ncbi:MAG: hypothetical protein OQK24_04220 [Magnetovibrio sp.]|nr:hypothetical protein [Magnetovibrio sp.]
MGGFFSAPPPPPPPAPQTYVDNTAEQERQDRIDMIERRRRGRAGTIKTSERGLLSKTIPTQTKKQLLGE